MSSLAPRSTAGLGTKSLRVEVYERLEQAATERLESAPRRERRTAVIRGIATGLALVLVVVGGALLVRGREAELATLLSLGAGVGTLSASITHWWLARNRMTTQLQARIERDVWHSLLERARREEQSATAMPRPAPQPEDLPSQGAGQPAPARWRAGRGRTGATRRREWPE